MMKESSLQRNFMVETDFTHDPIPAGLLIEKEAALLRITFTHFKPIVYVGLIGGIILSVIGIYLFANSGAWIVNFVFLMMGLLLVYSALTSIINKRTILVTRDRLKITYKPLPYEKNHDLDVSDLIQLYTHRMFTYSRYGDIKGFTLEAILRDGRHIPLLSDPSYDIIHFLEVQIETWLGIQDLQVPGEIKIPLRRDKRL